MKVNKKEEIIKQVEKLEEEPIDNKLELVKYTSQVKSRIKKDISSDFVLAKLNDKDKEGIIEMTNDAYFAKRAIEQIAMKWKQPIWDIEKKEWIWKKLEKNDKTYKYIMLKAKALFDAFMTRMMMTALLNRNVEKNYIVNILAQQNTETELPPEQEPEAETLLKKPRMVVQNEEELRR